MHTTPISHNLLIDEDLENAFDNSENLIPLESPHSKSHSHALPQRQSHDSSSHSRTSISSTHAVPNPWRSHSPTIDPFIDDDEDEYNNNNTNGGKKLSSRHRSDSMSAVVSLLGKSGGKGDDGAIGAANKLTEMEFLNLILHQSGLNGDRGEVDDLIKSRIDHLIVNDDAANMER